MSSYNKTLVAIAAVVLAILEDITPVIPPKYQDEAQVITGAIGAALVYLVPNYPYPDRRTN